MGLTNAPATFQKFINDILQPFFNQFCMAFLDDILIFCDTLEEHRVHVRQVLEVLQGAGLTLKPKKCEFHKSSVKFLGVIIFQDGVKMDPQKVKDIVKWGAPTTLTGVREFLGFANFYRRFIKGYSQVMAPMVNLTKKNQPFLWNSDCNRAFEFLKTAFTTAPVLAHFDPDKEILVETDASDYVSAGVMSQHDSNGILHPVAFFSKKHTPAECN